MQNQPAFRMPNALPKPKAVGYQTGFNAESQAANTGSVLGRLGKESQVKPNTGSVSGNRGVADLQKSQLFNDQAQMRRSLEGQNAQQYMQNQATRSELFQTGLSNQAKIYSDITSRATDQIGLAAKLQEAMIRNRFALSQAMLS